jgi:DNA-binding transcriptional MerR regulator/methylmalonyl-CoA mutase cobalamin-binding subunit
MTNNNTDQQQNGSALFPIRTVSDLTGVSAITLRAWERRYGLFAPVRKASGHRLYTQENIDLITRVVGLLDRGMRIGQVKDQLKAEVSSESGATSMTESFWKTSLDRMMASVIRFDEIGLEETYGKALSMYPVDKVVENLLMPLLVELGRRWEVGQGSVSEEHFFGFYIRNKLGARFHHRAIAKSGPRLLLACVPGDRHETGLLLFALAANNAGYHTIMLGADMPLEELPAAVNKTGASAVVLSGLVLPGSQTLEEGLASLTAELDIPVFLGGRASVVAHDALKRANVKLLGTNLKSGLERILASVPLHP